MFTVKLIKVFDSGDNYSVSIACPNYHVHERRGGVTTVTTFQKMTDVDGVERHVSALDADGHFSSCYVENIAGKTIASYLAVYPHVPKN